MQPDSGAWPLDLGTGHFPTSGSQFTVIRRVKDEEQQKQHMFITRLYLHPSYACVHMCVYSRAFKALKNGGQTQGMQNKLGIRKAGCSPVQTLKAVRPILPPPRVCVLSLPGNYLSQETELPCIAKSVKKILKCSMFLETLYLFLFAAHSSWGSVLTPGFWLQTYIHDSSL